MSEAIEIKNEQELHLCPKCLGKKIRYEYDIEEALPVDDTVFWKCLFCKGTGRVTTLQLLEF